MQQEWKLCGWDGLALTHCGLTMRACTWTSLAGQANAAAKVT